MRLRKINGPTRVQSISCCPSSKAPSRKISSRPCWRHRWPPFTRPTMRFTRQLANVETIEQQDSAERALNKLARTFAMQMEALKRYRTGGEQKVTVQHVSVNEGGQAIVANVNQAASGTVAEKPVTMTPALTDARQQAMPIIET